MKFTTKGRITLWRDGVQISQHVLAEEAYERAYAHAQANGPGKYTVRYPDREIDLTLLRTVLESPPSGITATPISATQVNVAWAANPRASAYRVFQNGTQVVASQAGTTYSATGLTASTLYNFQVASIGADGQVGSSSAQVGATTLSLPDTTAPTIPGTPAVTALSQVSLRITWAVSTDSGGSGLAGYRLERSANGTTGWAQIYEGTAATFDDSGLFASTTYYYRVRAYDGAGNQSNYSAVGNGTTTGSVSSGITPSMVVEYVDTSGVRQTTTVATNGSTTITGNAPFLVSAWAYGSRSSAAGVDSDGKAWFELGYRFRPGDDVAGTWPVSGESKAETLGQPMFSHTYETAGTYTARCRVRDSLGNEGTISLTVVVNSQTVTRTISTSDGSWGSIVSGGHYLLNRGSNYSSFGTPPTNGLHNVLFSATGSGADPIVGSVQFDSRNDQGSAITRSAHVRFLNIDVASISGGNVGYDYCGVIGGRARSVALPDTLYGFTEAVANVRGATVANNCRYVRGLFLWNCGEVAANASGYVIIGTCRTLSMRNVTLNKQSGGGGAHCFRGIYDHSDLRHNIFKNTVASTSYLKIQGESCLISSTPDPWRSDDRAGDYSLGLSYGVPTDAMAIQHNRMGDSGHTVPAANAGFGPENDLSGEPRQGVRMSSYEDNDWWEVANVATAQQTLEYRGQFLGMRNNLKNNGAGASIDYAEDTAVNRVPPGWRGPYYSAGAWTRPTPSAF